MKYSATLTRTILLYPVISVILFFSACKQKTADDLRIKKMDPAKAAALSAAIEPTVATQLTDGLTLKLWAGDSLIADPVAIDIDDKGHIYYTRTNRQKNSEFDIRGHQNWEIESIQLQSVEDKRAFLKQTLSPENSKYNTWLADLNGDGSRDWKDLTIEKEHVYRVDDISGDGVADQTQLVIEDFHDEITDVAGGILAHNGELFLAVGPDLWRLRDNDDDGLIDEKTSISHGYAIHIGFGAHGMSGVEVGPEGKIYWQIGDIGFNGKGPDGQQWEHPNNGVVVRSNPDGTDFEVFAYGVRNTHEFVFDEYGNLISVDNDGDHQGEKERIVYIVNGSDTGWRINWQFGKYRDPDNNTYKVWMDEQMYKPRFEGQAAYITPAIANYVSGPAGMLYNPGTALGEQFSKNFFVVEFVGNPSRSGIHAFTLNPSGASFALNETKMILSGIAATGIDFGPDGAMYVADWIEGWGTKEYGRIWKLDVEPGSANPKRKDTQTFLGADLGEYDEDQLSALLKHDDMRVRQKAQFELATRGADGLRIFEDNIKPQDHQLARVHAIWGISQFARKDIRHAGLLLSLLKDADPEIRAQAAKWIGDVRFKDAGPALIPLLQDENSRARFFAAEALGRIAYEPAINPIIAMLRKENDEDAFIRHAGSLALARIGKADPIVALAKDESRALRIAAVVALRRLRDGKIQEFLSDADEFIVTETARAINDDLSIVGALPALGNLLVNTNFKNEALLRRSINANLRVGTDEAMQNLMRYAQRTDAPVAMRAEAIAALSTWAKPSVLDRVDGRYRGVVTRDPEGVNSRSTPVLIALTSDREAVLRRQAVKAIGKMKIQSAAGAVMARLRGDTDPQIRVESLRSLAAMPYSDMDAAVKQALSDKDKRVRIAGLDLLATMDMHEDTMVVLLSQVIDTRTMEERQAALLTLGKVSPEKSKKVFASLLARMEAGKLPVEIQLELGEALDSTHSEEMIHRFADLTARASADSLVAAYRVALVGGDVNEGRDLFFRHQTAQCTRCHSFNDYGGNAGPRLNGVAARLTREQLLESLIKPSARIASGFGTVSVGLKNGKTVAGILAGENADALIIRVAEKPDTTIRKEDIAKQTMSGSSMPPMHLLLTKREIRDLLSFLATLKED